MSAEGRRRVARRSSEAVAEARAWQRSHKWPTDPGTFAREIGPLLADLSVRMLVEATGLSAAYCRRIKRGQVVPHPMWWARFEHASSNVPDRQDL